MIKREHITKPYIAPLSFCIKGWRAFKKAIETWASTEFERCNSTTTTIEIPYIDWKITRSAKTLVFDNVSYYDKELLSFIKAFQFEEEVDQIKFNEWMNDEFEYRAQTKG